jgi:hypothetical protein
MTNRVLNGVVLLVLFGAVSSCGDNLTPPSPASPSNAITPQLTPPLGSVLADATLFGMVYEVVAASPRQIRGIEGVAVYCEQCGESTHNYAYTGSAGNYRFPPGVWTEGRPTFPVRIWIGKDGYKDPAGLPKPTPPNPSGSGWREVVINGDTRFDVELVRQ